MLFLVKLQTKRFVTNETDGPKFQDYLGQVQDPFNAMALWEKAFSQYFL